jgi:hypothetical protein
MITVAIVSPGYPGAPGGVTDHTARLVAHWTESGVRVDVLATLDGAPDAAAAAWRDAGAVATLIQYVPFLYGHRGLSRIPEQLACAAAARGLRVVTFVHEPWVPPTRLPWLVLSPVQRRQLRRILAAGHGTVTPVPRWRALVGDAAHVLYVGSTLGEPPPADPAATPLDAPLVFSPFAAGLAWDWIAAAVRAVGAGLAVIGADEAAARRHRIVGGRIAPGWTWYGRRPATEVLTLLSRARLVLAPYVDGMTGRRTAALAALSTGARTLTSEGRLLDPLFRTSPMTVAGTRDGFAEAAARLWSEADSPEARASRVAWYRKHLDPRTLDRRLLELLTGGGTASPEVHDTGTQVG